MNIATFMSLAWVLFGSNCDYYKSLQQIFKTLELKEVHELKAKFTPEHCRCITWAILDDGRPFFDDIKTTIDFTGPDMSFPQSYLIDILNNVWYVAPIKHASFPDKWRHKDHPKKDRAARTFGARGADSIPVIPHQPEGDMGKPGAATSSRVTMDRVDSGDDRDSPPMQDKATTPLGTEGEISSKEDHHTLAGVAAAIGGWDGQISTTLRSKLMDLHLERNNG